MLAVRNGTPLPSRGPAYDPDVPAPGFYRVRLRSGAPWSVVRIWLGHGIDEATGEEATDRPFHWQCSLNGQRVPLEQCWPGCAREQITQEEHDRIVSQNATMDETSPFFDPARRIDLRNAPAPF
jgi:hypothetical protein